MAFTISYGSDYVNVKVSRVSTTYPWYRIFVRRDGSSTSTVYDEWVYYTGSSKTYTVDGLSPETGYAVNVFYSKAEGDTKNGAWMGAQTFTTKAFVPDVDISVTSTTSSSLTVKAYVDSTRTYTYYRIQYKKSSSSSWSNATSWVYHTSNYNYTISGLSSNTEYDVRIQYAKSSSGSSSGTGGSDYGTTDKASPTAYYVVQPATSRSSITIRVYYDTNYPYYRLYCQEKNTYYPSTSLTHYTDSSFKNRTSTYFEYTITGLSAGTQYTFNVQCCDTSSVTYAVWLGKDYGTTLSSCTSTMSVSLSTYNSASVKITSDRVYKYYKIYYRKTSDTTGANGVWSDLKYISGSSGTYTISGLDWDTSYIFNVYYYFDEDLNESGYIGTSSDTSARTITTSHPACTASFSIVTASTTEDTIYVKITPDTTNYPYYQIYYREYSDSTGSTGQWDPTSGYRKVTSTTTYPISGLDDNTKYAINVRYAADNNGSYKNWIYSDPLSETTKSSLALWYWNQSNGSATATQTSNAYTAVTSQGYTTSFSYLVWNDMCDKVQAVLTKKGKSWNTSYGLTLAQTKMSTSDKILTAARWNSLRFNVGRNYPTGLSEVNTGDIVYGSYFTTLMSKVNEWIQA